MTDVQERDASTTKRLDTLVADIYHILDERTDHEVSEANVVAAGEGLMALLRSRFKKREIRKGEDVLRFSAIGKPDRRMWYEANTPEAAEKMPGKQNFKFLFGDIVELLALFLAKEAGHTVTHEQHEVSADGVLGHVDCILDGVLVDIKSASPYGYDKFKSGDIFFQDSFGYIPQLSGYANTLGAKSAAFVAINKVDGSICVTDVDEYTIAGNKPEPRIAHLKEVIASSEPPARCYPDKEEGKSGNRKLGVECSYCPFKDTCWADANEGKGLRKFHYSRGPTWLTVTKKEPNVPEAL